MGGDTGAHRFQLPDIVWSYVCLRSCPQLVTDREIRTYRRLPIQTIRGLLLVHNNDHTASTGTTTSEMYPNQMESAAIRAAERLMTQTMARYDPSHDVYHGQSCTSTRQKHVY